MIVADTTAEIKSGLVQISSVGIRKVVRPAQEKEGSASGVINGCGELRSAANDQRVIGIIEDEIGKHIRSCAVGGSPKARCGR